MQVMVLEQDHARQADLAQALLAKGFQVLCMESIEAADCFVRRDLVDVLVLGERVGGRLSHSLALLAECRNPMASAILLTERTGPDMDELFDLIPALYAILGRTVAASVVGQVVLSAVSTGVSETAPDRVSRRWAVADSVPDGVERAGPVDWRDAAGPPAAALASGPAALRSGSAAAVAAGARTPIDGPPPAPPEGAVLGCAVAMGAGPAGPEAPDLTPPSDARGQAFPAQVAASGAGAVTFAPVQQPPRLAAAADLPAPAIPPEVAPAATSPTADPAATPDAPQPLTFATAFEQAAELCDPADSLPLPEFAMPAPVTFPQGDWLGGLTAQGRGEAVAWTRPDQIGGTNREGGAGLRPLVIHDPAADLAQTLPAALANLPSLSEASPRRRLNLA